MIHRTTLWILNILVYIVFAFAIYAVWALLWPVQTIEIKNFSFDAPVYVETPVLHAGDLLTYELDYCKQTDIVPIARRQLIDGQTIPLTATSGGSGLALGCHKTTRSIEIPETVNPGRYYLNVYLDYRINPFRTETVRYYTQYFQVVDANIESTSKPAPKLGTEIFPAPADAMIQQ